MAFTISDYRDKLHKLENEIQYIDQQRQSRVEEYIKTKGAIEALEQHECASEESE